MPAVVPLILIAAVSLAACTTSTSASPSPPAPASTQVEGNQRDYENSTMVATCLTDRGWEVEVTPGGGWGIEASFPPEQADVFQADYDACIAEAGLDNVEMTEVLASEIYDNNQRVTQCLDKEGFSTTPAPSRSSFIAKMVENPEGDHWNPYELVSQGEVGKAVSACPQ